MPQSGVRTPGRAELSSSTLNPVVTGRLRRLKQGHPPVTGGAVSAATGANADELADLIHAACIPSTDLSNVTTEHWRDLARAKGRGFAISRPAQNKLIRDVINAVRLRQA